MALVAQIQDGKVVESTSQTSLSKATSASNNGMDKDAFLQLLVAQMKYQDPLEPTSNTEYISQYAQFSQVEQMQNMASSMDLQRASGLVGQQVYIKTTTSTGETNYVQGRVDYVVYENNKAYLAINESLYSIEDLDTVVDEKYLAAYDKATEFVEAINKLPNIYGVDISNAADIDELEKIYNEMTEYEKSFVASDVVSALNLYILKLQEIRAAAEDTGAEDNTETDDSTKTEDGKVDTVSEA